MNFLKIIIIAFCATLVGLSILLSPYTSIVLAVLLITIFILFKVKSNFILKQEWMLRPLVFFSFFLFCYLFFGSVNVSEYRGTISLKTIIIIGFGIISVLCGIVIGKRFNFRRKDCAYSYSQIKQFSFLLILVSIIALFVITLQTRSWLFINQEKRFFVRPYLFYFLEIVGLVPLLISSFSLFSKQKVLLREKFFYYFLPIFLLLSSGYRGFAIPVIAELVLVYYFFGVPRKREKILIGLFVLSYAIISFGFYSRRLNNRDLTTVQQLSKVSKFDNRFWLLAPIHFTFRENIGLTQRIIEEVPQKKPYLNGKLLVSDMLTILPGTQIFGGEIINDYIVRGNRRAGLTPSVFGAFYLDFGIIGVLFGCFLIGLTAGSAFKYFLVQNNAVALCILLYTYVNIAHFIHRGIFKPSYFFYFIVMQVIFGFSKITSERTKGV